MWYRRVTKFYWYRNVPKSFRKKIFWAMSLEPGDIVSEPSGFNSMVMAVYSVRKFYRRGWYVNDVHLVLRNPNMDKEYEVRLSAYEVSKALPPEEVTKAYTEKSKNLLKHFTYWFVDNVALEAAIAEGKPICDENGFCLYNC